MLLLISEEVHTQFFFSFPEGLFQNEPFDWPTTNLLEDGALTYIEGFPPQI
jgi:hypothetical protein